MIFAMLDLKIIKLARYNSLICRCYSNTQRSSPEMLSLKINQIPRYKSLTCRYYSNTQRSSTSTEMEFDAVYSLPFIKYFALFNRFKFFHMFGSGITIPACGLLESLNIVPEQTCLIAAYIGITGAAVLSLASLPTRNIIGFLYTSKDKEYIKISSVTYWGSRRDTIIRVSEWTPLIDLPRSKLDSLFVRPTLADGTKYSLLIMHGKVHNQEKMTEIFE